MPDQVQPVRGSFTNPVYPDSFPDPFVLKFGGEFFAYATGFARDGSVFPVLHSSDLVNWVDIGGAMRPLDNSPPYYWAPEVSYHSGKFYLYYSVGNEVFMELRVAVSDRPDGSFADAGVRLTKEDFAIDAHVFVDDDGSKYLFYATDFLEHSHIGTGTVVDRMIDWFTLAGFPRPVTRAKYDWQVYDPNRKEKGGVRWHTVEGPAVLKRKGRYYEMFSGGNWQNMSYGVSFAVTDDLESDEEWLQLSDGVNTLPILRTIPGLVIGPGHNCVVNGPNNRELYCVYHRWTEAGRVMAIDRLDFAGDRMFVLGATHTPQPAPYSPKIVERFLDQLSPQLERSGDWTMTGDAAVSGSDGSCEISLKTAESFLIEVTLAFDESPNRDGEFGIELETDNGHVVLQPDPPAGLMIKSKLGESRTVGLTSEFLSSVPHVFRIDHDYRRLIVYLDSIAIDRRVLDSPIRRITLFTKDRSVVLKAIDVTEGFEELFDNQGPLEDNGWSIKGAGTYQIADGEVHLNPAAEILFTKGPAVANLEFAVNFRFLDDDTTRGEFGLILSHLDEEVLRLSVGRDRLAIRTCDRGVDSYPLPEEIRLTQFHQLRVVRQHEQTLCYFDDVLISEVSTGVQDVSAGVFASGVPIALEMIRLTSI